MSIMNELERSIQCGTSLLSPILSSPLSDKLVLPEDVYIHLICTECGNYLSVGPVMVTPDGGIVCGRCPKPQNAAVSLYNKVVGEYFFKCVNHHNGCQKLLQFDIQVKVHENACNDKKYFECPCCPFFGNGCELLYHFRKLHVNAVVLGDTLERVLSYHKLGNYANAIASTNTDDFRLLLGTTVKMFSCCYVCKNELKYRGGVYLCRGNHHVVCVTCTWNNCPECKTFSNWDSKTALHRITMDCEWYGCTKWTDIFSYMRHKRECKFRQYRCPGEHCDYVGDLVQLQNHWHLSPLRNFQNYKNKAWLRLAPNSFCYCLTPSNDIIRVECYRQDKGVSVLVTSEDVISECALNLAVKYFKATNNMAVEATEFIWKYKVAERAWWMLVFPHFLQEVTLVF